MPSSPNSNTAKHEVLFATANQPNKRHEIFTEGCLQDIAANDPRCRYDEEKKQLWIELEPPQSMVEEMFQEIMPEVRFVDVTPKEDN
jgi:hypothetical protein